MANRLGARALGTNTVPKAAIQTNAVDDTKLDSTDNDTLRVKRRARVLAAQAFS